MPDFLDKLVGGINKGVATVGANSKALMEKSKINSTINNTENERVKLVKDLGQKVYDSYKANVAVPQEEMDALVAQIDKCLDYIARQREELKRIDEEAAQAIKNSSLPVVPPNYTPQSNVPPYPNAPQPNTGPVCQCGHTNTATAKFCAGCGSSLAV